MSRKVRGKPLLALLLACGMALGLLPAMEPASVQAASVDDLQAQKAELAQQEKDLQAKKDALSGSLDDQKQRKEYIEQQIALKQQEIGLNQQLIDAVERQIADKDAEITAVEQQIADKEAEIADRFSKLQGRLRTISKTGNLSTLQMLFSTDDYVDYLIKSKMMKQIATNDQQLIDELETEIAAINKQKQSLMETKAALEKERENLLQIKADADRAKEDLDALCDEVKQVVNDLQGDLDYYTAMLKKVQEDEAALEAEIDRILAQSSSSGSQLTGKMYWPSSSCTIVTDTFGGRYLDGAYNFHKGIDIACYGSAYGKDIIAAADGTVIYANKTDDWGSGYGYYLMVDHGHDEHGQRIVTLYAHCSRILVSEGDRVTGGSTQLAEVGNTGWSYGSHLHFEVRVDGTPVDPLTGGWVSIP